MPGEFDKLTLGIYGISSKMRQLRERIQAGSALAHLNQRQLFILERLALCGELSPTDIRGYFPGIAASTITGDLKILQEHEWAEKRWSPKDQRIHLVGLTEKGKQLAEENLKLRKELYKPLLRALKKSEAQLPALIDVVEQANNELGKELASLKKKE